MHTFLILKLYHYRRFILFIKELTAQVQIAYDIHQNFFIKTNLNLAPKQQQLRLNAYENLINEILIKPGINFLSDTYFFQNLGNFNFYIVHVVFCFKEQKWLTKREIIKIAS